MKLLYIFIGCFFILTQNVNSQKLSTSNWQAIKLSEDTLKKETDSIINAEEWMQRFKSDAIFIKALVKTLKTKHSFYYSFDSLKISVTMSPDSSFKIFTWQVMKDYTFFRQRGAIQMNSADGSLQLFPLFDVSDFTKKPNDSLRDANKWIGAVYYKIIKTTVGTLPVYTLLGSDENSERTNIKWIDVLTFDADGKPVFGAKIFTYPNDGIKPPQPVYRFNLEFKRNSGARIRWDEKEQAIIFDHLTSENNDFATKSTLVPYGDYEGFRWQNGKWCFTDSPFDKTIPNKANNILVNPIFKNNKTKAKKR
jgi:hypothetical protein